MSKQKKQKRGSGHGTKQPNVNIQKGMGAIGRMQAKERIRYDQRTDKIVDFLLQIGCDAFILSNADLYDMQPGRVVEAVNTYRTYINELAAHLVDDADADDELVYFWTDLDRRLQQICGTNFATHDKRYDETGRRVFAGIYDAHIQRIALLKRIQDSGNNLTDTEQLEQSATASTSNSSSSVD